MADLSAGPQPMVHAPREGSHRLPTLVHVREVDLKIGPVEVLRRWPRRVGLGAVIAGDGSARYSILGVPARVCGNVREIFAGAGASARGVHHETHPPFTSGWIVSIAYEYGYGLEATGVNHVFARAGHDERASMPPSQGEANSQHVIGLRLDGALVHDGVSGVWWRTGGECAALDGVIDELCSPVEGTSGTDIITTRDNLGLPAYTCGALHPLVTSQEYERAVLSALSYIRSGDVYQVNVTHPLVGEFEGCALAWFADRCALARPRYGCYVGHDGGIIASLSPELLFHYDAATHRLITRPMKGTRLEGEGAERDLRESDKDGAELAMIVDLLRNDLGRICTLGSVRVEEARTIETHGGGKLLQATATISGTLSAGTTLLDAFHACFPGGSVTGAPKSRAMQIIQELEEQPRGHYCGCAGYIADAGDAQLNITIRTAQIRGVRKDPANVHALAANAQIVYYVGAGIVADSDPASEWEETLAKAAPVR